MQVRANSKEFGRCGCGRSADGYCDGSHAMTEEQWAKAQKAIKEDPFLNSEFIKPKKETVCATVKNKLSNLLNK